MVWACGTYTRGGLGEENFLHLMVEVDDKRLRGRPRKTCIEVINNDLRCLNATRIDVQNMTMWRRIIRVRGPTNLRDV